MANDPLMSRLRRANPERPVRVSDDELRERILSIAPGWASDPAGGAAATSRRHVQRWLATGVLAAAILVAALVISLSGRTPSVAQAFPVLSRPSVITPTELQSSLAIYGVSGTDMASTSGTDAR